MGDNGETIIHIHSLCKAWFTPEQQCIRHVNFPVKCSVVVASNVQNLIINTHAKNINAALYRLRILWLSPKDRYWKDQNCWSKKWSKLMALYLVLCLRGQLVIPSVKWEAILQLITKKPLFKNTVFDINMVLCPWKYTLSKYRHSWLGSWNFKCCFLDFLSLLHTSLQQPVAHSIYWWMGDYKPDIMTFQYFQTSLYFEVPSPTFMEETGLKSYWPYSFPSFLHAHLQFHFFFFI